MTYNIYVASYKRARTTTTKDLVEYCTYVVRKSEEKAYRDAGIKQIWAVEDNLISSFAKVQNYIIENAPEDIVCVLDDDIKHFRYSMERNLPIKDIEISTAEIERCCQLVADLDVGVLICRPTADPRKYNSEFSFKGCAGPMRIYNRKKVKARYGSDIKFFVDTDFNLQELLVNRITLCPNYFCAEAPIEKNAGGMQGNRIRSEQLRNYSILKGKWGKYISYTPKNNTTKILVPR